MKTMVVAVALLVLSCCLYSQNSGGLPAKWEELTTPDFIKAVSQAKGVCIIPLGIVEKHGPHMPVGTDLLDVRAEVVKAVKAEYAVVFPEYYFGQINEARHQPGTLSYSPELIWKMLLETCDEVARNGFQKIILVNGHGGNNDFLPYFCMSLLSAKRNYAVYLFKIPEFTAMNADLPEVRKAQDLLKGLPPDAVGHAGADETSMMLAVRPELVRMDQVGTQSGANLERLASIPNSYAGIWWYAKFPNHYEGDAKYATPALGSALLEANTALLIKMIREVKADTKVMELQNEFYEKAQHPIDTKQ